MEAQASLRLNRHALHKLAKRYAEDANILLGNGRWSTAYYLAGYAVECALKACIAKQFREHDFPDKQIVNRSHTHDLRELLRLAELESALEARKRQQDGLRDNWDKVVVKWKETSRYEQPTQAMAEELVRAVGDPEEGVLPWLEQYW
jgi:AbiV family abortive infection protein